MIAPRVTRLPADRAAPIPKAHPWFALDDLLELFKRRNLYSRRGRIELEGRKLHIFGWTRRVELDGHGLLRPT
jgi:hypothetical protein